MRALYYYKCDNDNQVFGPYYAPQPYCPKCRSTKYWHKSEPPKPEDPYKDL